jgi:hypothetical protein
MPTLQACARAVGEPKPAGTLAATSHDRHEPIVDVGEAKEA